MEKYYQIDRKFKHLPKSMSKAQLKLMRDTTERALKYRNAERWEVDSFSASVPVKKYAMKMSIKDLEKQLKYLNKLAKKAKIKEVIREVVREVLNENKEAKDIIKKLTNTELGYLFNNYANMYDKTLKKSYNMKKDFGRIWKQMGKIKKQVERDYPQKPSGFMDNARYYSAVGKTAEIRFAKMLKSGKFKLTDNEKIRLVKLYDYVSTILAKRWKQSANHWNALNLDAKG